MITIFLVLVGDQVGGRSARVFSPKSWQTRYNYCFTFTGGGKLSTVILRPNVMYGEGDASYIPKALETAKQRKGKLPVIGRFCWRHALL